MTVIVTVDLPDLAEAAGVLGLTATPPALDSAAWRKLPPPAAALRLLDELGDGWNGDEAVVVVHPPARMDLQLVLQSLAGIVGRENVVDVPLGRTPLVAAVSATFADDLAHEMEVPLGLVPELLRTVERQASITALLTGVGRLDTPQPRWGQQLAGYWPTTRALVHRGRTDRVRVLGRKHGDEALGHALAPSGDRLVVALSARATSWMREVVIGRHDTSPVPVAVLTGDVWTAAHWDTDKVVEAVGLPPRWRAVVRASIEDLSERTCSWCAQRVNHVDACDLCSDSSLVAAASRRPPPPSVDVTAAVPPLEESADPPRPKRATAARKPAATRSGSTTSSGSTRSGNTASGAAPRTRKSPSTPRTTTAEESATGAAAPPRRRAPAAKRAPTPPATTSEAESGTALQKGDDESVEA